MRADPRQEGEDYMASVGGGLTEATTTGPFAPALGLVHAFKVWTGAALGQRGVLAEMQVRRADAATRSRSQGKIRMREEGEPCGGFARRMEKEAREARESGRMEARSKKTRCIKRSEQ